MTNARALVVDDDPELRTLIVNFLSRNGLDVEHAADAAEMDAVLKRSNINIIILDLMLPGEDGLSIIRRLRQPGRPAVIMLSAMGEETDRIIGLEVGADDYIAKPCNPRELLARVRAVLRRREGGDATAPCRSFGEWTLNLVERQVTRRDGKSSTLTDAEFRVLSAFLDRPQRVLSRDQLLDFAKGSESDMIDRAIDVTISRLRKKLGDNAPIRTLRGEGYVFSLKVSER